MPRKTKEEKFAELAKIEAEQKAEREKFQQELPAKILYNYLPELDKRAIQYRIFYKDNEPAISIIDSRYWVSEESYKFNGIEEWQYNLLLEIIKEYDAEKAEADRKANIRRVALAKLNQEELKELGLGR